MSWSPRCAIVIKVVHVHMLAPASVGGMCESVCLSLSSVSVCMRAHLNKCFTRTRLLGTKNSSWELQQHNPDLEENKLFDLSLACQQVTHNPPNSCPVILVPLMKEKKRSEQGFSFLGRREGMVPQPRTGSPPKSWFKGLTLLWASQNGT